MTLRRATVLESVRQRKCPGDASALRPGAGIRIGGPDVLAMVLDHAGVQPNPARDRLTVKMPREERRELNPPTAEHVLAVHRLLPRMCRQPLLVLDGTGMRVGELEALTWG
jgi:integrase